MASKEPEIMEVDIRTASKGKITTQKLQKTAAHKLYTCTVFLQVVPQPIVPQYVTI